MMMWYQDRSRAHRDTLRHSKILSAMRLYSSSFFCTVMLTQTAGEAESCISKVYGSLKYMEMARVIGASYAENKVDGTP